MYSSLEQAVVNSYNLAMYTGTGFEEEVQVIAFFEKGYV